jgi:adenylate cyclase
VPDEDATGTMGAAGTEGRAERVEALARVRTILEDLGCTDEEIDRAVADDVVDLLMVDRLLVPDTRHLTQADVASITGEPVELVHRFWRALGFLDLAEDDPALGEMDVEAVRLFQAMVEMGLVDRDVSVQIARVIGLSMARIASAQTRPGATPLLGSSGDSVLDADQFARQADASIPAVARLLEYVWRRHLQAATRRAMLRRARGESEGRRVQMAIGFADMVGFTVLSQHLGDDELAAVVARFEELAQDTVVALGGRVVKMIGDEVMFVVPSATAAADIGLSLAEAYAGDDLLSDIRVGLAIGPVLEHDGDYYGPVVNLAGRVVNVARPGTVVVSDEFRTQLFHEDGRQYTTRPLRARTLKDVGKVQLWKLVRVGTEPGADRRRPLRWERLGAVLLELDELADRADASTEAGRRNDRGSGGSPAR